MLNPGLSDLTGSYRMYKKSVLVDLMTSVKSTAYVFQMEVIQPNKSFNRRIA